MTREQIARELDFVDKVVQSHFNDTGEGTHRALQEAIKLIEQEPCEDCISRQEAIEQFIHWWSELLEHQKEDKTFDDILKALPSVTPQPKTGYWIRKERADDGICCECSNCGHRSLLIYDYIGFEDDRETWSMFDFDTIPLQTKNYCSNCGLKMEAQKNE